MKYHAGHRFGQLVLVEIDRTRYRATLVCDCGNTAEFQMSALIKGNNTDCGCSEPTAIYFIRVNEYMKIGRCKYAALASRLSLLQTNCPYEATLVRTMLGTRNTEQQLHRAFQTQHHRGEWFHFSEAMLDGPNIPLASLPNTEDLI
jgi:hypothetical protein